MNLVLRTGIEIASALDKAHCVGIVHRDLKPGNVMLTKTGAKLLDFGLAKSASVLDSDPGAITVTQPLTGKGMIVGTFQYMAPEQLEGLAADARTDIFAFGSVLYEMATGKRAFEGHSRASLIASIMSSQPRPITELQPMTPPALERLARKCLAKDPDERWQSAADLADELRWIAEGGSEGDARTRPGRSRHVAVWALATVTCTLIANDLWLRVGTKGTPAAAVVRSSIDLSPLSLAGAGIAPLALSPDGRNLALVAGPPGEPAQIWVRPLSSFVAQPLPGTEDATHPFWSPDSKHIAFFSKGKLRRVPAAGGAVTMVCDAKEPRGGSWSIDNVIVFAPEPFGPLMRVGALGGSPNAITDPADARETHRLPCFLPDGKHLLYTKGDYSIGMGTGEIRLLDLDSGKSSTLLKELSLGLYMPPNHLIFVREANLMTQPFDVSSAKLQGDAVVLAEGVEFHGLRFTGSISVSTEGTLIYRASLELAQLEWFDMDGRRLSKIGEPARFLGLSLAPNAERAAAVIRRDDGGLDAWLCDTSRGTRSRLVENVMYPTLA